MRASLVVTTYNRKEALHLVLLSAARQAVPPHELIVADDGSSADTRELVLRHASRSPFPIRHVWQEDDGFRAGRIRNMGIAAATCRYVILVDGDMVLHRRFVEDHVDSAEPQTFGQGSRVLLGPETTARMTRNEDIEVGFLTAGIGRRRHTVRSKVLSRILTRKSTSARLLKSCNQGFWREDLVRVNGFNEDMKGWGLEDDELGVRLLNAGIRRRSLRFAALAYHLHHKCCPRERVSVNHGILAETARRKRIRCDNGLDQHLRRPVLV